MTSDLRRMGSSLALASLLLCLAQSATAQLYSAWSAPVNLNALTLRDGTACPPVVNSAFNDTHPAISKDGLSLFFASTRPGPDSNGEVGLGDYDLWVAQRESVDDCWLPPVNLGAVVNSSAIDFAPNLSTDGHWLFFHSKRPGGCGAGANLWVTHRRHKPDALGWETPVNLGCTINTPGFDSAGPTYVEDEQTDTRFLYFTRKPTSTGPAPDDFLYDVYVSTCTAELAACNLRGLWQSAVPVDALNSPFRDTRTAIRQRDGLEIILSSGRPGTLASENLWVSTRATIQDQSWLPAVPINCEWQQNVTAILNLMPLPLPCSSWAPVDPAGTTLFVNSAAFDGGPALSWEGTELYFFRVRSDLASLLGCQDPTGVPACRDLYVSKRTKLAGSSESDRDHDSAVADKNPAEAGSVSLQ